MNWQLGGWCIWSSCLFFLVLAFHKIMLTMINITVYIVKLWGYRQPRKIIQKSDRGNCQAYKIQLVGAQLQSLCSLWGQGNWETKKENHFRASKQYHILRKLDLLLCMESVEPKIHKLFTTRSSEQRLWLSYCICIILLPSQHWMVVKEAWLDAGQVAVP